MTSLLVSAATVGRGVPGTPTAQVLHQCREAEAFVMMVVEAAAVAALLPHPVLLLGLPVAVGVAGLRPPKPLPPITGFATSLALLEPTLVVWMVKSYGLIAGYAMATFTSLWLLGDAMDYASCKEDDEIPELIDDD